MIGVGLGIFHPVCGSFNLCGALLPTLKRLQAFKTRLFGVEATSWYRSLLEKEVQPKIGWMEGPEAQSEPTSGERSASCYQR
jgi:hypothetical protein